MGLFTKKKKEELPLPPPPQRVPERPMSDFEPIRPPMMPEPMEFEDELPPLPELPEFKPDVYPEPVPFEPPRLEMPAREEEVPKRVLPSRSFVAVEDYKQILQQSNFVRERLMEAENMIKQLKEIKEHEDGLFEKWRVHVEQIERKLSHVDQVLSGAQR